MAEHLPSTEIRALTSPSFGSGSNESNGLKNIKKDDTSAPTSPLETSPKEATAIARMFTNANIRKTHTQHQNIELDIEIEPQRNEIQLAELNAVVSNSIASPSVVMEHDPNHTFRGINKGEKAINIAINSRERTLCSFMPKKCNCNCSDRLTMQKTKFVIYLFPFFLVFSCFYVLITQQNISQNSFFIIVCILICSYIIGWICILCVLSLLQCVLIIRDTVFWWIVSKWNLEQKKAFIQAYSGVDLKEEIEKYQHSMRIKQAQKLRANEEMQLIKNSQTVPFPHHASSMETVETEGSVNSEDTNPNASLVLHSHNKSETPIKYENIESNTLSRKDDDVHTDLQTIHDVSDDDLSVTELSKRSQRSGLIPPFKVPNPVPSYSQTTLLATNSQSPSPNPSQNHKGFGYDKRIETSLDKKHDEPNAHRMNSNTPISVASTTETMIMHNKKESLIKPYSKQGLSVVIAEDQTPSDSESLDNTPVPTAATALPKYNDTMILNNDKNDQLSSVIDDEFKTNAAGTTGSSSTGSITEEVMDIPLTVQQQQGINNYYNDDYSESAEFNEWGTEKEEQEAFLSIDSSFSANLCKHFYRCCPIYRMKIAFCLKMSFEICLTLSILLSLFFFVCVIVFVTNHPFIANIDAYTNDDPYVLQLFSNREYDLKGDASNDYIFEETELTKSILTNVVNYEQTFEYAMNANCYKQPKSLSDLQSIVLANNGTKKIRVMGKGRSNARVYIDNNEQLLIDLSQYPSNPIINELKRTVIVNASMSVRDLNYFLFDNGYVLHGFGSFDDISIGGALGSCSMGPLFEGKSIGYYLISASIIDAFGKNHYFEMKNENDKKYLSAIRCNLGVLGIVHQVELQIFELQKVHRTNYEYPSYANFASLSSADLWNDSFWNFMQDSDDDNDTQIIGKELLINPYSDDLQWTVWTQNDEKSDVNSMNYNAPSNNDGNKNIFDTFVTPMSCIYPFIFVDGYSQFINDGGYENINDPMLLTNSLQKTHAFTSRFAYVIPQDHCVDAIADATDLAYDLYDDRVTMLPMKVTFIEETNNKNRSSLLGYDNMNSCVIEIQINVCSQSRTLFAEKYEQIIVDKYNGSGHWAYLWIDQDKMYKNKNESLAAFDQIRLEMDPNNIFLNQLYTNLFDKDANSQNVESSLLNEVYPSNLEINLFSFYAIGAWFVCMFILYFVASYYRILPFLDARSLCDFQMNNICCNDMHELDELIKNEQEELKVYADNDKFEKVADDLIDVEILDPVKNEYLTITVTFKTAFLILMDDENYRQWKYREKFAVSRDEELADRFERFGEELAWKSIYPRQCLLFGACILSISMLLIAIIQASFS